MSITNHVTNLRKRPDHEKKRIALAYSGAVTGVIFVVWLSVLLPRSYERTMGPSTSNSNLQASAFSAGSEIQEQFGELENQFNQVKEQFPAAVDPGVAANADGGATTTDGQSSVGQQYDFGY